MRIEDLRQRLRTLGAQRRQLSQAMLVELAVVGGIAGLIAAAGAMALGQVIARRVFDLDLPLNFFLPALSTLAGALLAVAVGWFAVRRLLEAPPLLALRAGS